MPAELRHEEYIRHYEWLQEHNGYGTDPMDAGRAIELWNWIVLQLPRGATIIDCSCGRGFLVKLLRDYGYDAEGTEASEWLISQVLRPRYLPVRKLYYSELGTLPSAAWDAVVSNDVLEHLFTEDEARAALCEFARMSRKWLLITVGLARSNHIVKGNVVPLHHIVQSPEWWVGEVSAVAQIRAEYTYHASHVIFAEVRP